MIALIGGASHSGKTLLSQRLMERRHIPYVSIDHLKMGLIRAGLTTLTPEDDRELTDFLWPILREMVKTAVENDQNLLLEGCYIPYDWAESFSPEYRAHIRYCGLVLEPDYIRRHMAEIRSWGNAIERRLEDDCTEAMLLRENAKAQQGMEQYGLPYVRIAVEYDPDAVLLEAERLLFL